MELTQIMKYKVLLVQLYGNRSFAMEEIGIGYITAVLRKYGYTVAITGGAEEEVNYEEIKEFKPDIVGVCIYKVNKQAVYTLCKKIKQLIPRVYISAGGYLATYHDVNILQEANFIDFVIRGEGEFAFLELVKTLENNRGLADVKGLTYRKENKIIRNEDHELIEDLNVLPLPARDFLINKKLNIALVSTSRGCKANCHFCIARNFWMNWRGRNVDNVLEELAYLRSIGIKKINFIDTSFEDPDPSLTRLRKMAQGIIDKKLNISYFADVRAGIYKKCNNELIDLLKKSGLRIVIIGIETGNEFDLKLYGKRANLVDNNECIEFFKRNGIFVNAGFINFNPYSSFEGLYENILFLEKHFFAYDMLRILSRYQLAKGSQLYDKIENDGLLKNENFDNIYDYKFINETIEKLYDYLIAKVNHINEISNFAITYISSMLYYMFRLHDFREHLTDVGVESAVEIINAHFNNIENKLRIVNKSNSNYFQELLSLAQNDWNEKDADDITNNYVKVDTLLAFKKDLEGMRLKFYRVMLKKYGKYIEDIEYVVNDIAEL